MARPREIITKSELAKELGLSKVRVSQFCKMPGFPVRSDGRISLQEALAWYRGCGLEGQPLKRGPKPKPVEQRATCRATSAQLYHTSAIHDVVLETVRRFAAPEKVLKCARVALKAGCSPAQAFRVATWFSVTPSIATEELTEADLNTFNQVTEEQWRSVLGTNFDFEAAGELYDRAEE